MNAPAYDITRQVAQDLRMPPPGYPEGEGDGVAAGLRRTPVWSLTDQTLADAPKPGLRSQGWFWVVVSLLFHTVVLGGAVYWGVFATDPVETPPVLLEFSLDGLPGIGGSGGDGREAGSAPAVMADAAGAQAAAAAPEEPVAAAAEPAPKEVVAPPEEPKPVLAERETPPPPKVVQPPKPAPKPKVRPKPAPRPKVAAKAETKTVAPATTTAASTQLAAAGTATASATGSGLGQGLAGQGTGKGPGQGDGAPGLGAGAGGAGGGTDTGLFGKGNGPRFRHRCLPRYPSQAKMENKEGRVRLRLTIDASGILRDVDVLGHDGLEFVREAVHAIQSSTFYPATHCGHPILSRALLVIRFKLG